MSLPEYEAPPPRRDWMDRLRGRALPMFGLTLLTLGLGYWLKARCLDLPWVGGNEFRHFCYTDVQALYGSRGWGHDAVPYRDAVNEYPVLTGAIAWLLGLVFEGVGAWWHANALLFVAAGLGVTYFLWREGHDWRSAVPWIIAPTLALDGFTNWDLWAVFFMVAGLVAFRQGRLWPAGILIGLGAAAKLFPAVVGPAFLVVLFNRARRAGWAANRRGFARDSGRLAAGFLIGWLPINLVFFALSPSGWWATYAFHKDRGTSFQTPYFLYEQYLGEPLTGRLMTVSQFNAVSLLVFLLLACVLILFALRRRSEDAYALAAGLVAAHIFANKFFSLQYALWLLPFFVLARLPRWIWATYVTAHAVCYVWANHFRTPPPGSMSGVSGEFIPLLNLGSFVFLGSLVAVMVVVARQRAAAVHGV